jgi:hypothetical protein
LSRYYLPMRTLLLILSTALVLPAQPTISVSVPASISAGAAGSITISASKTSGSGLTSVGFTITLPASVTFAGAPTSNQSSTGIFGQCAAATTTCFVGGFDQVHGTVNLNAIADGALLTIPIQVAATSPGGVVTVAIANLLGASGTLVAGGVADAVTAGPSASMTILSRCDTNSDGAVNVTDVEAAISAFINKTACPIAGDTCAPAVITSVISASLGGACGA